MDEFHTRFDQARRQGNLIFRLATGFIALVFILMVVSLGLVIYFAATTSLEDIARSAGHLVATFDEGRTQ
jgi:hypothetical protein